MRPLFPRRLPRCCRIGLLSLAWVWGCNTQPLAGLPTSDATFGSSQVTTLGGGSGGAISSTGSSIASSFEQWSLESINRARLLPADVAAEAGIAIDEGIPGSLDTTPKPAVAMSAILRRSAAAHNADMLGRNYFDHESPEGVSPFDRMRDFGYVLAAAGENLAWRGTTGSLDLGQTVAGQFDDLFVDQQIEGRGHRVTMLNAQFREVGIGIARGSFTRQSDGLVFSDSVMQTQDYATNPSGNPFVLGVVYVDRNQNDRYDLGEGVSNSLVSLNGEVSSTNLGGGYAFEIEQPGSSLLRFGAGPTQIVTLGNDDSNIKIDLVDGSRIEVNLGLGPLD